MNIHEDKYLTITLSKSNKMIQQFDLLFCLFVFFSLRPSQKLWSIRDGQFD